MDTGGWFIALPVLLLGVLAPIVRNAHWRTAALLAVVSGPVASVATLLPWHEMSWHPDGRPYWFFERAISTGTQDSRLGLVVFSLGLLCSASAWIVGVQKRPRSLEKAMGLALLSTLAAVAAVALTVYDRYFHDALLGPDLGRSMSTEGPLGGILLALCASLVCMCSASGLYLKLLSMLRRTRTEPLAADLRDLRRVFD